jgi:hypothetical protein
MSFIYLIFYFNTISFIDILNNKIIQDMQILKIYTFFEASSITSASLIRLSSPYHLLTIGLRLVPQGHKLLCSHLMFGGLGDIGI